MKRIKKVAAFMLAMIMALSMTMITSAANGNYKLSIDAVAGHTYKIYQLATGDVSSDGATLSNIKPGKAAKQGVTAEKITQDVLNAEANGEEAIGNAAWDLINDEVTGEDQGLYTIKADTSGMVEKDLPGGYYVIVDTFTPGETIAEGDALSRFMVKLVADVNVTPKTTTVRPDKKIVEDNTEKELNEASIGDTITYRLKGTLPNMEGYKSMKFVFVDTLSKGLTLTQEFRDAYENETELIGTVGNKEAKFKITDIEDKASGETVIRIALVNAFSYKDMEGLAPASGDGTDIWVKVEIKATVNQSAEIVDKDNPNKMVIEFNNQPNYVPEGEPGDDFDDDEVRGTTAEKEVKTYTTELAILKTDSETGKPLTGAEFELSGTSANVGFVTGEEFVEYVNGTAPEGYTDKPWYKLVDGAYTQDEPKDATANQYADTEKKYALIPVNNTTYTGAQMEARAFVDKDGKVKFTGLGVGTYTLKEVTTPNGYNTLEDIQFEVTWNEVDKTFKFVKKTGPDTVKFGDNSVMEITVPNAKGTLLPSTGGIGTTIFYVVGAILVIGAGIILVTKKRMSKEV